MTKDELNPIQLETSEVFFVNQYLPGTCLFQIPYHLPVNPDGEVKTFNELAADAEGIKKIAMFKADIDNLGAIFSFGMGKKISISRYAALSRHIHYFFSSFMSFTLKKRKEFSNIYTVFSGGDDLCLIGPWDAIMQFAQYVRKKFKEFTGENESITISGGITLASSTLPVRSIAHNAEEMLEESKKHTKKNQITVFDTTVSWEKFEQLITAGQKLYEHITAGELSTAVVYRLLQYCGQEHRFKSGEVIDRNALWRSHFHYDVSRNIGNEKLREWLISFVEENIKEIRIPVSYALYRARTNNKEGE
jgi:CRISPR-associated protein Csm1